MLRSDINEWLNDEVVLFYNFTPLVSLSSPDDHVGMANSRDEDSTIYPFVGIRKVGSRPESAGLGNRKVFADTLNYDDNDVLTSIDYRREVTYNVELVTITDGNQKLRDDLSEELAAHFSLVARLEEYPDDVEKLDVDSTEPDSRTDEWVYGEAVPLDITYSSITTRTDIPAAESVNLDVDVSDDLDVDVDDTSDPDAFDETFS
jgi:hypothetical protein